MASPLRVTTPGIRRSTRLTAALTIVLSTLAGCGPSSGENSAAASIAAQEASFPLYVRGEYGTDSANEAWIESIPAPATSMRLPAGTSCGDLQRWLRLHGGVDSGWSYILILLRARRKADVVVTAAESVILKRVPAVRTPHTVTCVPDSQSWVDQEEDLEFPTGTGIPGFKLDMNHYLGTAWQPGDYQPGDYSFNMNPGAQQYLEFTGYTSTCDCEWGVELYLTINGKPKTMLVIDGGAPFRTVPGPPYPDDSPRNAVWCAVSGKPRLVTPSAANCPPPTTYEEKPVY